MSGHSKWAKIRHAKGIADARKGKVFSKLAQQITIAVKEGGGDINSNASLRLLVEKARAQALPTSNIERAINRGLGIGKDGEKFEECVYEGIGPSGVAFIIDVTTDNKNRVLPDLRKMFSGVGGSISEGGSLLWNFVQKGRIEMRCGKMVKGEKFGEAEKFVPVDAEKVMMSLMDVEGIVDIEEMTDDVLFVITEARDLFSVKKKIEALGYVIDSHKLVRVPNLLKDIPDSEMEKVLEFIEKLEEYSDVQGIWCNVNL